MYFLYLEEVVDGIIASAWQIEYYSHQNNLKPHRKWAPKNIVNYELILIVEA